MKNFENKNLTNKLSRLIPLFLIIFIDSLGYFLVIPVLLRLFLHGDYNLIPANTPLAIRNMWYGITVTLSPLAFSLLSPVMGSFSDTYGRKKTLLFCLIGSFIGFILPVWGIFYHSLALILFGRFIAGAASSSQAVAQAAIADFTQGKQKAFYLSLIGFAMTLAMVLGPLGGSYFSDTQWVRWFNVMTPYWIGVGLSVINVFLLIFFYFELPSEQKKPTKIPIKQAAVILFEMLFRSTVSRLLLVFFLLELAWSQYYQVIFLYLSERYQYTPTQVALFTGYIGIWMSLGLTVFYRLAIQFLRIKKILMLSIFLTTVGFFACMIIPGVTAQWIFVILIAIFVGMAYPSLLASLSNNASAEHQGWVMGVASTLLGIAWMLTAFLSGWLINIYHRLPFMFAAVAIFLGLCVLLFGRLNRHDDINYSIKNTSE